MNLECNQIIDQKTRHFLHFIPDFHVVNDHLSIHQSSDQIFLFFNWSPVGIRCFWRRTKAIFSMTNGLLSRSRANTRSLPSIRTRYLQCIFYSLNSSYIFTWLHRLSRKPCTVLRSENECCYSRVGLQVTQAEHLIWLKSVRMFFE